MTSYTFYVRIGKCNIKFSSDYTIFIENNKLLLCYVMIKIFEKIKCTVKPVLISHPKIDNTKILMTNGSLMKVESIAECSKGSILQYF